ncbi:hypothetical protein CEH05_06445 [Halobacillus halophilus]|uniref:Intracellular proteinase inhibitor n=1 Tax=Halobacillus halophilus (strain ATCC 35676 / DSM 2266 / JCM 20832 / KCTC 3685 / LMG 17431 / NBRC 102448 / NCIMB 2269) TaxID=866895 RepID=I0JKF5_HALH3|nr:BsuPI-related putative proteinase inhibitor [Halobacillus halophilus]ASF38770.1 hypothetical protein CEH05_06445 [Halobacillus halophilus]CCG44624.1 intracellular proteinase inhibitor [Halobacillus halophilus DSM 2266]
MKHLLAILMGVMMITMAACGNEADSETKSKEVKAEEPQAEEQSEEKAEEVEAFIQSLNMEANVETSEETADFQMSLENTSDETVTLGFTSSQEYEIHVTNAEGESVYTFSADKMFTQEMINKDLVAGESLTAEETWTGIEEPGDYEATITFLVNSINEQPLEAEPFQLTKSFSVEAADQETGNSQEENEVPSEEPEKENPLESDKDKETNEEVKTEEKTVSVEEDGFRNIEVSGKDGAYTVTGEAHVSHGEFTYLVEDGHHVLIEPETMEVGNKSEWAPFTLELSIPNEDLPDFGTVTLTLVVNSEDSQDETIKNVPLEEIAQSEPENDTESTTREVETEGEAFRNVTVSGENGAYTIEGEARVHEGSFIYTVEDGHYVLVEPTSVQVVEGAPAWSSFEIEIDISEEDLPTYGSLTLTVFEESAEDGSPVHVNHLLLQKFN